MKTIYIVDVDGTVADCSHRRPLLQFECFSCLTQIGGEAHSTQVQFQCPHCGCMDGRATEESWQLFMQPNELLRDVPMPGSQKGIKALERAGYPVHYLTARELYQREATIAFLSRYFGFNDAKQLLVTRTESITGKRVKSAQFKENAVTEVLKPQLQERYGDHTLVFLDDHYPNLNMFARHGIALKSPEIWKAIHT